MECKHFYIKRVIHDHSNILAKHSTCYVEGQIYFIILQLLLIVQYHRFFDSCDQCQVPTLS